MIECRTITVPFAIEGIHYYKDAPGQVAFLKNPHRHIFNIKATLEVMHNDRELEFFMVKAAMRDCFNAYCNQPINFGGHSCEDLATTLGTYLQDNFKKEDGSCREITVSVQEDDECSAEVYFSGIEDVGGNYIDE